MPEPTLTINLSALQLEGFDPGETIKPREPKVADDGVLNIGKPDGSTWRYLPEGYGPTLATAAQLQQLSEDLQSLRDIAVTDEALAAEVADIQATIDAIVASGATDSELSAAIGPIQAAIALLVSADSTTATAIAAVQASVSGLDQTYATDAQLNQAIAALGLPVRSATAPAFAPNVRWTELDSNGAERYPWTWTAFNRGTTQSPIWEWRGSQPAVASIVVVVTSSGQTLRIPYPWRRWGGIAWRLLSLQSNYFVIAGASASTWTISLSFQRVSPDGTNAPISSPSPGLTAWTAAANQGKPTTVEEVSSPNFDLLDERSTQIAVSVGAGASGRTAQGNLSFTFVPVRL